MKLARAAATLLAMAVLVACSDDPEPRIEPSESPTSPSSAPATTESSQPPEMLGPEETVRAWVDARNTTVKTGDASGVRDLSAEDCETCVDSYGPVEQIYLDGGHYETDGWRVTAAEVEAESKTKAKVSVGIVYAAGRTFPSKGADPIRYDEEHHVAQFDLVVEGDVWKISAIVYLS